MARVIKGPGGIGKALQAYDKALSEGKITKQQYDKYYDTVNKEQAREYGVDLNGKQTPKPPTQTTTPQSPTPAFDPLEAFKKFQQAQADVRISGLKKAKESALGSLSAEESQIAPRFAEERRGITVRSAKGRKGFDDYLASRGLGQSGAGAQSELAQNLAESAQMAEARRGETQAFSDIARRRSDIETGFARDVEAARAGAESDALNFAIDQANRDRAYQLQLAGLTGDIGGMRTLAGQSADIQRQQLISNEARQALQDQISTIGQYGEDYQAEIDRRTQLNPNDPLIPYLRIARQNKIAGLSEAENERMLQQQAREDLMFERARDFEQEQYDRAFNLWRQTGRVTTPEQAQILGVPVGTSTSDQAYRNAQLNLSRARLGGTGTSSDAKNQLTAFRRGLDAVLGRIPSTDLGYGRVAPPDAGLIKSTAADYIVNQMLNGGLSLENAQTLTVEQGLTRADIDAAQDRIERNQSIIQGFDPLNLRR